MYHVNFTRLLPKALVLLSLILDKQLKAFLELVKLDTSLQGKLKAAAGGLNPVDVKISINKPPIRHFL